MNFGLTGEALLIARTMRGFGQRKFLPFEEFPERSSGFLVEIARGQPEMIPAVACQPTARPHCL